MSEMSSVIKIPIMTIRFKKGRKLVYVQIKNYCAGYVPLPSADVTIILRNVIIINPHTSA